MLPVGLKPTGGLMSLKHKFKQWLARLTALEFDWIQLEVSSCCNASCVYCPHTVYNKTWSNQRLPLSTFKVLLPVLANAKLVFLQGWGEPFLNPDIFDMVALAKEAGCMVGTTTNGMLFSEELIDNLLKSGIDIVAFSLAGKDKNNDNIRKGTCLETILDTIRVINTKKKRMGTTKPEIHISYLLLRSGIEELEKLPVLLKGLNIRQIVISTLDFVPDKKFENETLFSTDLQQHHEIRKQLDRVVAEAKHYELNIHYHVGYSGKRHNACTENPQSSLFISADGSVSPCVFAGIPVSEATYSIRGTNRLYQRQTFGNINKQSLYEIWNREEYVAFRRSFVTGQLATICRNCHKLYTI